MPLTNNLYKKAKDQYTSKMNNFINNYCFFAFNQEQLENGLKKFNIEHAEIKRRLVRIHGGGLMIKEKIEEYRDLSNSYNELIQEQIKLDTTGDGFILDMFIYELDNHEYGYTYDDSDATEALGFTYEQIEQDSALLNGLRKAKSFIKSLDIYN